MATSKGATVFGRFYSITLMLPLVFFLLCLQMSCGGGTEATTAPTAAGKMPVTPEEYGAKGDGVTDDSEAFIRMWAAINKTNGTTVTFKAGTTYFITKGAKVFANDLTIIGNGATIKFNQHLQGGDRYNSTPIAAHTIPNFESNCAAALVFWDGVAANYVESGGKPSPPTIGNTYKNISIYGLNFDGGGGYNTNSKFYPGTNWQEKSYHMIVGPVDGFIIEGCTFRNSNNESIRGAFYANNVRIRNNRWENCGHNALNFMSIANSVITNNTFEDVIQLWEGPAYKVLISNNISYGTSRMSGKGGQLRGFWIIENPHSPTIIDVTLSGNTLTGTTATTSDSSSIGTPIEVSWTVKPFAAERVIIENNKITARTKNGKGHIWIRANPGETAVINNQLIDQGQINWTATGMIDIDNIRLHSNFIPGSISGGRVSVIGNNLTLQSVRKFTTLIYLDHKFDGVSGGKYSAKVERNTVRIIQPGEIDTTGYTSEDAALRDKFFVKLCKYDNYETGPALQTYSENIVLQY